MTVEKFVIKKAAVGAAAIRTEPHPRLYQKGKPVSSLKRQIGKLLFALQAPLNPKQQQVCWILFETILRQYLDLKIATNGRQQ